MAGAGLHPPNPFPQGVADLETSSMARDSHGRLTRAGSIGAAVASLLIAGCGVFLTPQHRLERAQREMNTGRWQDAAVDLRNVLQKEPNNAQAWLLLAQLS